MNSTIPAALVDHGQGLDADKVHGPTMIFAPFFDGSGFHGYAHGRLSTVYKAILPILNESDPCGKLSYTAHFTGGKTGEDGFEVTLTFLPTQGGEVRSSVEIKDS